MRLSFILLLLCAGCAARTASTAPASVRSEPTAAAAPVASAPPASSPAPETVSLLASASPTGEALAEASAEEAAEGDEEEGEDEEAGGEEADEGEAGEVPTGINPEGPLYTAELSDEELTRRWKDEPGTLGSVSVGFVESGRLVNSVRFPEGGDDWLVVSPEKAYTTEETVAYLTKVIREVRALHPTAPPLRVNQISAKEGGYMRPHKSHQNGRDVDLGFYYPTVDPVRVRARENHINVALNWALIKALIAHSDVQLILVDRRVQKVIYDYALKSGEDKAWVDSLFHGAQALIKHARGHRDHFHVRFFNPRAQELGRRIAPLLALQPEQNIAMHRVRSGDTLGAIAVRYNSTVNAIRKSNRIRGHMLRIGQVLSVPLRGPCTRCPIPAPVVVPPRRVPASPQQLTAEKQEPPAVEPPAVVSPAVEEAKETPPVAVGTPNS